MASVVRIAGCISHVRMLHVLRSSCLLQAATKSSRQLNHVLPVFSSQTPYVIPCTSIRPASNHAAHDHSRIWSAERILAAGLLGLVPAAFFFPNPVFDHTLALALTAHIHWGVEAIVVDYIRPNVVGPALSKVALAGVYFLTTLTLGGLFYFNYSDVGLTQAIKMLWKL